MHFVKIFAYDFDQEALLSFIQWWIKSANFDRDVKKGDDGAVRDIDHTIRLVKKGEHEIIIVKDAIMSDGFRHCLYDGEFYMNKRLLGRNGFNQIFSQIKKWLEKTGDLDPCLINQRKALEEGSRFDMVGIGFFIENTDSTGCPSEWALRIHADVVGIPK